jgi:hypothetical protein
VAHVLDVAADAVAVAIAFAPDLVVAAQDASPRPISTMTLPYSSRLTTPLMMVPARSLNSSYWRSRSASRTFCRITCLADCAAIRPMSTGGTSSMKLSPICGSGSRSEIRCPACQYRRPGAGAAK